MNKVSYTPNYQFNLFGIGKKLRQGRNIGGNYEAIWIKSMDPGLSLMAK